MSTILGADEKPTEPTEAEQPARPESNGRDKSETRDVRTVPMGVLMYNLMLCANGLQMNKMMLEQLSMEMKMKKIIIDPPEVQQLKAILEHQHMARDVMVGEINFRFKEIDERRIATMDMQVVDRTPKEGEAAPIAVSGEPV
jgi:hypothetical protein